MNTIQTEIINDIRGAKTSIKVAVSWFTDPLIIDELIKKAYEKKDIKVIVSGDEWNVIEFERFDKLQRLGATVNKKGAKEFNQDGFMHTKFMIVDDSFCREGSYNFTKNAARQDNHFRKSFDVDYMLTFFDKLLLNSHDFFMDIENPTEIRNNLSILEEEGAIPEEKLQRLAELKLKKAEERLLHQQKEIEQAERAKKEAEAAAKLAETQKENALKDLRAKEENTRYQVEEIKTPVSEAPPRSYANEQE
jgi:phosphatidylserine/phosphatidylglycerophosphate/cardiolipin synthase-like enzyme